MIIPKTWTPSDFETAVKDSKHYADVCRKLNLQPLGGNYRTVKKYILEYKLDTSHFEKFNAQKLSDARDKHIKPLSELLVDNASFKCTKSLKKRLVTEGLLENKCYNVKCILNTQTDALWAEEKLVLHLEHKNGNNKDNRIDNLIYLCPNCHSQTATYCGRNASHKRPKKTCEDCGKQIYQESTCCKSCAAKRCQKPKIIWPTNDELVAMLKESTYVAVAKLLGVSDNAIRKHMRMHVR